MAGDKPSFLNGIDPTEDEAEVMGVLSDEGGSDAPDDSDESKTKPDEDGGEAKPDTGADSTPEKKETEDSEDNPDDKKDDADDSKVEEKDKKPEEFKDKKPEKPSDEEVEKALKLKFGTFKTPEEAEKAFKELQRTLTRLRQAATAPAVTPAEKKEQKKAAEQYIELAKKTPLVDVKIPNSKDYVLDDGSYDMDNFAKDLIQNTVMALQQEMIGGQLGSLQFGMIQEAIGEEFTAAQQKSEANANTKKIENKLYEEFPILKDNEEVAALMERAIFGEVAKRKYEAGKTGKEFVPMVEEDFVELAKVILKNVKVEAAPVKEEEADRLPRGVVAQPTGGKAPLDEIDQDIEDMMNVKKKSGSIF